MKPIKSNAASEPPLDWRVSRLEPDGGNLYRPHKFMVNSGQFWRCKHGATGFVAGMNWGGCAECETDDPAAFAAWKGHQAKPDNAQGNKPPTSGDW